MRTVLLFWVIIGGIAAAAPADRIVQELPKPSPTMGTSPAGLAHAPAVVWRRDMSQRTIQPAQQPEATTVIPPIPEVELRHPPRLVLAVPGPPARIAQPSPGPAQTSSPWPKPARSREQVLNALGSLRPGASKAVVLASLGEPAYSIGIPEAGHFIERCRFRVGMESLASVEFRDGFVSGIDRIAP